MDSLNDIILDPYITGIDETLKTDLVKRAKTSLFHQITHCFESYAPQWFHKTLCVLLDAFIEKRIKNLIIEMPPRHGKSEHASRHLPAAIFGRYPNRSVIAATYSSTLAKDMLTDCGRIMSSDEYREIFPDTKIPLVGQAGTGYRRNADMFEIIGHKGKYFGIGLGQGITGKGGDYILIDDLIKNFKEANSAVYREAAWKWYVSTLMNRGDSQDVSRLITFTRWHDDDLIGRLLKLAAKNKKADQWVKVRLPAIMDGPAHKLDKRPSFSNLPLWPGKFGLDYLLKQRAADPEEFSGIYQQNPIIKGGNKVKQDWFKYWDDLPSGLTDWHMFWDLTFSGEGQRKTNSGSYTVGQVWAKHGGNFYLVHQYRGKPDFFDCKQAIRQMHKEYKQCASIIIEKAANGFATQSDLQREIPGIDLVSPKGSKVDRLSAVTPYIKSGNVYLPRHASWLADYLHEMISFPRGTNDDQVDATSLALHHMSQSTEIMDFDFNFGLGKTQWTY